MKGTAMKTDRVLTISECLANWYIGAISVKLPTGDARHVPISADETHRTEKAGHCRCDRWGHPCEDCEHFRTKATKATPESFNENPTRG